MSEYPTVEDCIGDTPLVRLQRIIDSPSNKILLKLEGNNPAGSVKDRAAMNMIQRAEARGDIKPGDTLIEATSGNTGIALAMAAAIKGYKMILVMPSHMSDERKAAMAAFGAELLMVTEIEGMEGARDFADLMQANGKGIVLNQFANFDNPLAHYEGTAPEIYRQTCGQITHFVSSMGTTGTIVGCSKYFKEVKPEILVYGLQPSEGSKIPGIRRWSEDYLPEIYDDANIDFLIDIEQGRAEETMRRLASEEGIFCGISSGGAITAALDLSHQVTNATIVAIVCDRGDRYLSTGIFSQG